MRRRKKDLCKKFFKLKTNIANSKIHLDKVSFYIGPWGNFGIWISKATRRGRKPRGNPFLLSV